MVDSTTGVDKYHDKGRKDRNDAIVDTSTHNAVTDNYDADGIFDDDADDVDDNDSVTDEPPNGPEKDLGLAI